MAEAGFINPDALMRIRGLEIRARVVMEGFMHGFHRSPYHGFSVEFSEYRHYSPGDEPRHLDWKVFARTDRLYIKRFEDETNLRCHLLVDLSRSMNYGSLGFTKLEYARTLAATLAQFLFLQRDAVGLMSFDEKVADYIPAKYRPGHLHRLMVALGKEPGGRSTNLEVPIKEMARTLKRRGLIVLISDLLAPIETLETNLGYLNSRGHDVIIFRILDPAEKTFNFEEPALFEDMESGREVFVDPAEAKQDYSRKLKTHSQEIVNVCSRLGIDYYDFTTDRPLELGLFDFLAAREKRGRRIMTRGRVKAF